ncbi:MAG: PfkB family carbohydrate kinase [Planctomycetota bacterium]
MNRIHDKILTRDALLQLRADARQQRRTVVQCHGCFDIVHPGHIRHLRFAARQGDILLVTVTADQWVGKGDGRPLFTDDLRAENLAALDFVDWVYVNPDPTACDVLDAVQPDIYIKGQEYERNRDPRFLAERTAVERHGGRVVFSSGDLVFSSTDLVSALARGISGHEEPSDPRHAQLQHLHTTHDLSVDTLTKTMDAMAGQRIIVVGETIIDRYIFCDRPTVASEASCLSIRPIEDVSYDGGAAIIAQHAASLGADVTLVSLIPDTDDGRALTARLAERGVRAVSPNTNVPFPVKERYLAGSEKLCKIDRIQAHTLDEAARDTIVDHVVDAAGKEVDAVLLTDFRLGMFSRTLLDTLIARVRPRARVLAGDVSGQRHLLDAMSGLDLVTPSEHELRETMQDFESSLNAVAWRYIQARNVRNAIVTLGAAGAVAFTPKSSPVDVDGGVVRLDADHVPSLLDHAVDPLGCGDVLLTVSAMALASGAALVPATYLGSIAAAFAASQLGNIVIDRSAIKRRLKQLDASPLAVAPATAIDRNRQSPVVLFAS